MLFKKEDAKIVKMNDGAYREIFAMGGNMMFTKVTTPKGVVGPVHTHPHEQIGYVLSGKMEFTLGDEKKVLNPGDSFYAGPNVKHGGLALEDTEMIEVFTPQREDFLK